MAEHKKREDSAEEAYIKVFRVIGAVDTLLFAAYQCDCEHSPLTLPAANVLLGCVDEKTEEILVNLKGAGLVTVDARGQILITEKGRDSVLHLYSALFALQYAQTKDGKHGIML